MGVHDSVKSVDLEVLVRTNGRGLLNSSPISERWLRVIEPLVGQMFDVISVHMADSLSNLRSSDTASN